MSSTYLRFIIREQIDKIRVLKDEIPCRPGHAALDRLADTCKGRLEEQSLLLGQAGALLDGDSNGARIGMVLRAVKRCARVVGDIEGYGMPPLHCRSEQAIFLNDVVYAMHNEVGLPFPCPAVSCTSNEYYFTHPVTNTVYVPLSEAAFLLHMPDFYHELGHLLLAHSYETEWIPILAGMADAVEAIDDYYLQHTLRMKSESAPTPVQDGVKWMWSRWKHVWIQEAFCDLFALFAAGPAYAYSNLHLVSKMDLNIYELSLLAEQDHPSGEARMRLLDAGMHLLEHEREAGHVREEWNALAHFCGDPPPEYAHAFPSGLIREVAASILPAFGKAGLRGHASGDGAAVAALLNDAWRGFWRDGGGGFRDLENALISKLAEAVHSGAAACQKRAPD